MKSNRLILQELAVARDGATLIPPFTYTLNAGDLLVVEGANGSGKSSLLKVLAGLLPAQSGAILLNDQPLHAHTSSHILYMGHGRGLELALSVLDNVAFWAHAYGQAELIEAALHYFDLEDIADLPLYTLSAGWQQRVALTRLITQPGLLWLLDEPMTHLDTEGISLLQSLLQSRLEQGGIAVIVSHLPLTGERIKRLDLAMLTHHLIAAGE